VFSGQFNVTSFAAQNGGLEAIGNLTGTLTRTDGGATAVNQQAAMPVNTQQSTGGCEILDLVLGPLDLNLLGLEVHLDTVHLNITAQPGPGNLLGNLLCSIAGLLDKTPVNVNGLAGLLNNLLRALAG